MSLGSFYLYLVNITHWYALWASLWLCCMTFSQDSRAAVLFQPAPVKQHIICDTKPKSLHCFCSLTEKMCLFAKLIIVGVCFTGVLTLRLAVAFFIFPNTFYDDTKFSLVDLLLKCLSIMLSGFFPPQKLFCCACHLWIFFLPHSYSFSVVPRC